MIPSSLETFSTCVDKENDDNNDEDDDDVDKVIAEDECSCSSALQEKKVVIKLEDSDIEENRGKKVVKRPPKLN